MSKQKKHDESAEKKKNTSLRLSSKTLKALKIRAIEEDASIQQVVEKLVEDYLETPRKNNK